MEWTWNRTLKLMWRWGLIVFIATAVFWGIWWLITGSLPTHTMGVSKPFLLWLPHWTDPAILAAFTAIMIALGQLTFDVGIKAKNKIGKTLFFNIFSVLHLALSVAIFSSTGYAFYGSISVCAATSCFIGLMFGILLMLAIMLLAFIGLALGYLVELMLIEEGNSHTRFGHTIYSAKKWLSGTK